MTDRINGREAAEKLVALAQALEVAAHKSGRLGRRGPLGLPEHKRLELVVEIGQIGLDTCKIAERIVADFPGRSDTAKELDQLRGITGKRDLLDQALDRALGRS